MEVKPSEDKDRIRVTVEAEGEQETLRKALPTSARVYLGKKTYVNSSDIGADQKYPYHIEPTRKDASIAVGRILLHGVLEDYEVAADLFEYFRQEAATEAKAELSQTQP
jgi:hypothetical protein